MPEPEQQNLIIQFTAALVNSSAHSKSHADPKSPLFENPQMIKESVLFSIHHLQVMKNHNQSILLLSTQRQMLPSQRQATRVTLLNNLFQFGCVC